MKGRGVFPGLLLCVEGLRRACAGLYERRRVGYSGFRFSERKEVCAAGHGGGGQRAAGGGAGGGASKVYILELPRPLLPVGGTAEKRPPPRSHPYRGVLSRSRRATESWWGYPEKEGVPFWIECTTICWAHQKEMSPVLRDHYCQLKRNGLVPADSPE